MLVQFRMGYVQIMAKYLILVKDYCVAVDVFVLNEGEQSKKADLEDSRTAVFSFWPLLNKLSQSFLSIFWRSTTVNIQICELERIKLPNIIPASLF